MLNQVSFKPGPEDCYGRCRSDKIRQTVPDTCSGDRESSVTDGKSVSITIIDCLCCYCIILVPGDFVLLIL